MKGKRYTEEQIIGVLKEAEAGEEVLLSTLSKGRSIGEMAVIDKSVRSATVRAKTKATLVILSKENFEFILEDNCRLGANILKGISRFLSLNMRQTSSKLADQMTPVG